jgi:hypothetical protein
MSQRYPSVDAYLRKAPAFAQIPRPSSCRNSPYRSYGREELRADPPLEPRDDGNPPLQFEEGTDAASLRLTGSETFDVVGVSGALVPRMKARLAIHRADGKQDEVPVIVRVDTPIEVEHYKGGGILQYVLRQTLSRA